MKCINAAYVLKCMPNIWQSIYFWKGVFLIFSTFSKKMHFCPPNVRLFIRLVSEWDVRSQITLRHSDMTQMLRARKSWERPKNFWIWTIRWSVLLTGSAKWYFRVLQVPVALMSWNLACILIKAIKTHWDLKFVEMRNLGVPVVQLSRNLAEIFIGTIEAQ